MVPSNSFLDAMRAKWTEYGNVGSHALDQVWIQIAETMNQPVDEALDQVHVARITRSALNEIYDLVHPTVLKRHGAALDALESARRALLDAPESGNRIISAETLLNRTTMTPEEADAAVVSLWR